MYGTKAFMRQRSTMLMMLAGIMIAMLLAPAVQVKASEGDPYLPPGGAEWNKLRDIPITDYGWGYGVTVTDDTYRGAAAKKIEATDWWAAHYQTNGWQTINFAPYYANGSLEFDVAGLHGGEAFKIGFRDGVHERMVNGSFYKDGDENPEETNEDALSQDVNAYVPVTTEWQHVSIPMKEIIDSNPVFDMSKVQLLKLTGLSNAPLTVWISNLKIVSPDKEPSAAAVKVNQVGYVQQGEKYALVSGYYNELAVDVGTPFQVKRKADDSIAYSGALSLVKAYDPLSGEKVFKADFTTVTEPGEYYVTVNGVADPSVVFEIGTQIYKDLLGDVQKFFYFQRANVDLDAAHAGVYARTGLHKIDSNLPLQSNPSITKDVSGGWWDAGDTGKYVTAAATAVSDLLWAYETYPHLFTDGKLNIPESGNGVPDLLDEIKVETDFFLKMQDDATGGFYAYVIREKSPNRFIMDGTGSSSIIPTGQTANTVGALAHASIVFNNVPGMETYANTLLEAAVRGWEYLAAHPEYIAQPDGPYNDDNDKNDRFYAAGALYRATGEAEYNDYVVGHYTDFAEKFDAADFSHGINGMEMIGYYHYLSAPIVDAQVKSWFTEKWTAWRNKAVDMALNQATWRNSTNEGFYWGANANVASMPMSLAIGSRILGQFDESILQVAAGDLNYLLGVNPLQLSYITGYGENRVHITHHEIYMRDFIVEMPNGYMPGGPNSSKAKFPAKAYNESTIDWESNEQAINYNSPLTYLIAMLTDAQLTESIVLSRTNDTLWTGGQTIIEATAGPANATAKSVNVTSSDTSVATVTNMTYDSQTGKTQFTVNAIAVGSAQIKVASKDGRISASYSVTVQTPPVTSPPSSSTTPTTNPSTTPAEEKPEEPAAPAGHAVFKDGVINYEALLSNLKSRLKDAAAPGQTPADAQGHWAENTLNLFIQLGVLEGYKDGTVKPNAAISRAEFAALLSRVFNLESGSKTATFTDMDQHWAHKAVQTLASNGIIQGYKDGTFKPDQIITREEMAVILSRLINLQSVKQEGNAVSLSDLSNAGAFAVQAIQDAANAGLVQGMSNGEFKPKSALTRAEALQVILNALQLEPEIKALLDQLRV
ncbi:glycoside hydrolase family 9 protein [Paenibacillus kobensis]|uniref:glycoside hydrolase family 9 protein n=1 Tax=Paenibacillus kobensis TaxID=59841 RepID=UPI000FDC7E10|nr:glycoside hydrolase family 9 protein [Paenibacillus kobensis]